MFALCFPLACKQETLQVYSGELPLPKSYLYSLRGFIFLLLIFLMGRSFPRHSFFSPYSFAAVGSSVWVVQWGNEDHEWILLFHFTWSSASAGCTFPMHMGSHHQWEKPTADPTETAGRL
jgi:hypothetical protein